MHDNFNLHKKLKEISVVYRKISSAILTHDDDEAASDLASRNQIWKDYIAKLFTDSGRLAFEPNMKSSMTGTPIIRNKVEYAIQ